MANAFYSGSAASFAVLKTNVEAALVAEGWTLASGILSRGDGFFLLTAAADDLRVAAGTGQSGAALTGASPAAVRIGSFTVVDPIVWPINYFIHIHENPHEVYIVINHGVDRYQNLSFGVSPAPGNAFGQWINGTGGQSAVFNTAQTIFNWPGGLNTQDQSTAPSVASGNRFYEVSCGILAGRLGLSNNLYYPYFIRDNQGWLPTTSVPLDGTLLGRWYIDRLIQRIPSSFNQTPVLLPLLGIKAVADNGSAVTAVLAAARMTRIDHHEPGDIITFGSDRWKIYPDYRKNLTVRSPGVPPNASFSGLHTGTYAYALRYFGP
jgi:hypothetical protein